MADTKIESWLEHFHATYLNDKFATESAVHNGEFKFQELSQKKVIARFPAGKLKIIYTDKETITFFWKGDSFSETSSVAEQENGALLLNFTAAGAGKGEIHLPTQCELDLKGDIGKIAIHGNLGGGKIELGCGKIGIWYDENSAVNMETKVEQGQADTIPLSLKQIGTAELLVMADVGTIKIRRSDEEDFGN